MKNRFSIAGGFLALVAVGAILLATPVARASHDWGSPLVSAFTACSAVCVTGLSIVDIASEYSRVGQVILLSLVEIGCLGLMTCGTFLMVAIGRRLSLSREFTLMNAYGDADVVGLRGLLGWVIGTMIVVEAAGALVLYLRFGSVYESVFYSVMAFCNAGFSLRPDSLAAFGRDPAVILTLAAETIVGGIGFLVVYNLCTYRFLRRRTGARGRLTLHTQVVLRMTFWLVAISFAAVLVLEWQGALAPFALRDKFVVGFYQAVTPRTCGFSVVATESLKPVTRLVYEALMFVGGAPGSAAAGVKITTCAVLFYTLRAMCRGANETVIHKRVVSSEIVRESFVIFMALVVLTALVFGVLLVTESSSSLGSDALFFESISAITTTGLSLGDTTARLSTGGRLAIMVAMFAGRLGALTVVMMIGDREETTRLRYPSEELIVG